MEGAREESPLPPLFPPARRILLLVCVWGAGRMAGRCGQTGLEPIAIPGTEGPGMASAGS